MMQVNWRERKHFLSSPNNPENHLYHLISYRQAQACLPVVKSHTYLFHLPTIINPLDATMMQLQAMLQPQQLRTESVCLWGRFSVYICKAFQLQGKAHIQQVRKVLVCACLMVVLKVLFFLLFLSAPVSEDCTTLMHLQGEIAKGCVKTPIVSTAAAVDILPGRSCDNCAELVDDDEVLVYNDQLVSGIRVYWEFINVC